MQNVMSGDHRLDSVVLMSVVADEGYDDIVDVVVDTLVDSLTLVDNLVLVETSLDLILVAVTSSNGV